ncbi:MAG: toxic anion resistance protein [Lachnospiraceae bacterium]|nr:toxic anion resistance protein [Lachnospiraceae bacterium]
MSMDLDEMLKEAPTLSLEMPEPAAPSLTLDPKADEAAAAAAEEEVTEEDTQLQVELTEEERKMVNDFAQQIDITNAQQVTQFGSASQKKIADFSETALNSVKTKDLGEVGQMLTDMVVQLKDFETEEDAKGLLGMFKKSTNKLATMKAKYDKAEVNVNRISQALEDHQVTLLKDVAMLDKMYELNKNYYKELSMYILAGKQKLKEEQEQVLPALLEKAEKSGLPEDTQAARDHADMINRFEKKLHDLDLTRMVSMQMAPQIRLIQSNDTAMSDKIQSTLVNTIPLWKNQMVIAIGLNHSVEAAKAQHAVSDMTNEMLKKNAQTLKMATVETAKEAERGIIDIETLKETNRTLISTFDEVIKIQQEGRDKRQKAEKELRAIEKEMHDKLLEQANKY